MATNKSAATRVEITVLSGGTTEPALDFVAAAFTQETGHAVRIFYNLGAKGRKRLDEGEVFDVVVQTGATLDRFFRPTHQVEPGGVSIGRAGLGVLIREGAPRPDITSVQALRQSVLDAESLLYTLETSGQNIERMLRKLGVHEQAEAKASRYPHGPELMDALLKGTGAEFGFLSLNAIRTYRDKGVVLVGPLPEEVQFYYDFMAVPSSSSRHKEIAWQFAHFCAGPGKPLLVANGIS
jgi:molybdate transport system substrate-binding protein